MKLNNSEFKRILNGLVGYVVNGKVARDIHITSSSVSINGVRVMYFKPFMKFTYKKNTLLVNGEVMFKWI